MILLDVNITIAFQSVGVAPAMVSMVNVPVYGYQPTVMPAMMPQQPYRVSSNQICYSLISFLCVNNN